MAIMVNGELVTDDLFIEIFREVGGFTVDPNTETGRDKEAALRLLAERRVVGRVLLAQMARKASVTVSAGEVADLRDRRWGTSSASVCGAAVCRQLADDLLVEKYCQWLTRHEPRPSRIEVEQHYLRHRAEFRVSDCVRVSQIICNVELVVDEEPVRLRIERAEREMIEGSPFSKVAAKYSDCGGETILGWVTRGTMVPEFEKEVFALKPGERSGIFRTVFGFHIVTALERKVEGFEPFEEIRPMLARRIFQQRRQRLIDAATERALQTAIIEAASTHEESA